MSEQSKNPGTVAKGQIWDVRHHPEAFTVAHTSDRHRPPSAPLAHHDAPARRLHAEAPALGQQVLDVMVRCDGDGVVDSIPALASSVASWPLVPGPLAKAAALCEEVADITRLLGDAYVADIAATARLTGLPLNPEPVVVTHNSVRFLPVTVASVVCRVRFTPAPLSPIASIVAICGALVTEAPGEVTFTLPEGTTEWRRRDIVRLAAQRMPGVWVTVKVAENPREARRREIDAVLREDARRFPAFASARRAAVLAACEGRLHMGVDDVRGLLSRLHAREDDTQMPAGGGPWDWEAGEVYDRETGRAPKLLIDSPDYSLPFSDVWGLP